MTEIHNFMKDVLLVVPPDSTATEAAIFMRDNKVKAVLVGNNEEYVGIVTGVDFTRKLVAEKLDPDKTKVADIMSSPLITIDRNQPMAEAFLTVRKNQIRNLQVTEGNKIIGRLSLSCFAHYANQFREAPADSPSTFFWQNYEALLDENSFRASVDKLLKDIRKNLNDSSKTAMAIDKKEPPDIIAKCAREEGNNDLADVLDLADY